MIKSWQSIISACLLLAGLALLGADSRASFPNPPQASGGHRQEAGVLVDDPD